MVKKFKKKPVIIEAVQLTWQTWGDIAGFVSREAFVKGVWVHPTDNGIYSDEPLPEFSVSVQRVGIILKTLKGNHLGVQGDWIIKGVAGEFYPCKPDIFEKTYDTAE